MDREHVSVYRDNPGMGEPLAWPAEDGSPLPGPGANVPPAFLRHLGTWEGSYHHMARDGQLLDVHQCCLETTYQMSFISAN